MTSSKLSKRLIQVLSKYTTDNQFNTAIKALLIFYLSVNKKYNYISHPDTFIEYMNTDMSLIIPGYNGILKGEGSIFTNAIVTDICMLKSLYNDLWSILDLVSDDIVFSVFYELSMAGPTKKNKGVYYTPYEVTKSIVDRALENLDIINNPFIKILDPACGCGNFLSYIFDKLYTLYAKNTEELETIYGTCWDSQSIRRHILKNNLYGADIDEKAVEITFIRLLLKCEAGTAGKINIILCNSLILYEEKHSDCSLEILSFWNQKFDYIVGNPPYQNMQKSTLELKSYVHDNYKEIYNGQNDIYYYFLYRSISKLRIGGRLGFIVPVYFIEATYASKLRDFINQNLNIVYFEDLSDKKIFYKAEVHCSIIIGSKRSEKETNQKSVSINANRTLTFDNNRWICTDERIYNIIKRLDTCRKLSDYAVICKGMDTGLNKCFLINDSILRKFNIENSLLRPVVRSCDIRRYVPINPHSHSILYVLQEIDLYKYPNAYQYMISFSERLKLRWGYKNGTCCWYSMSTPRNRKHFENGGIRIFVPYRCQSNIFAVDTSFSIGLTDTTCIFPEKKIDAFYLCGLLNSKLIGFYNNICGKRKGRIYEFFPIPLSSFPIQAADCRLSTEVKEDVLKIIQLLTIKSQYNRNEILFLKEKIDQAVYELYGIDKNDIEIIIKCMSAH